MTLTELDEYFNSFLKKENFSNDISLNGIQIQNSNPDSKQIKKIDVDCQSKSWGNYNSSEWTITRTTAKFSEDYGKTYEIVPKSGKSKASFDLILLTTGADDVFAAKNIYDVAGNVSEWTSETHPLGYMIHRGQGYRNTESPGAHFRSFINYQFCACSDIRRFPSSTLYKIAKFYINWFTPKGTRDFGTRMPKSEQRDGLFSK